MIFNTIFKEERVSESGKFLCNNGIAVLFQPFQHNVVHQGGVELDGMPREAVRTLIVPSGIKGFAPDFCTNLVVEDIFFLPDSVESIGNDSDNGYNVFAGTVLPEVMIPESVKIIGKYAFCRSHIKKLVIREKTQSPYLRQFKDSTIDKVYLPKENIKKNHDDMSDKFGFYRNFYVHCHCEIIEY